MQADRKVDYERFKLDYISHMGTREDRLEYCPPKTCIAVKSVNGVATERFTTMPSKMMDGSFGAKIIFVSDETGEYVERFLFKDAMIDYSGLTADRCALMAKLCLELLGIGANRIGFLGNGRVNKKIHDLIRPSMTVIHGAKGREGKNRDLFYPCYVDVDFSMLNECDVVFVCTNSYSKENLIDASRLHPRYLVVFDCGYALGESFRREYISYCDYPEQLRNQYAEEFPFDNNSDYEYKPLVNIKSDMPQKACIYVHGCGICDLSVAKQVLND